jgi:dihydrodipicolinate synthase/N-acetylneuraminate lyase
MQINFIESSPIPVKAAMAMMGLVEEVYRLPLVSPRPPRANASQTCCAILVYRRALPR